MACFNKADWQLLSGPGVHRSGCERPALVESRRLRGGADPIHDIQAVLPASQNLPLIHVGIATAFRLPLRDLATLKEVTFDRN
jgi:hypothetical protein